MLIPNSFGVRKAALLLSLFLVTMILAGSGVAAKKRPPLHHVPATNCSECHAEIYSQWSQSMHGQSTAIADPIHGAFYNMLVGSPTKEGMKMKGNGKFPVCLQCHAPNAARDGVTKLDAMPAYSEGVNCVACHTMKSFKGVDAGGGKLRLGAKAYGFSKNSLQGSHGAWNGSTPVAAPGSGNQDAVSNPFPHTQNAKLFKSSEVCLGCHEQRKNSKGVPVCATGPEMVKAGTNDVTCQSCHMPVVNGVADHSMGGGHNTGMLRRGLALSLEAKKSADGITATASLKNILPHKYPTGAPFRYIFVKVSGLNAAGEVVWQNFTKSPIEDKKSVMMLKLGGPDGKPAPPPKATQILGDSRLAPNSERTIEYAIADKSVTTVRAEAFYNLLLPPFVKKLGPKLPAGLTDPVSIARAEATL